MAQRPGRTSGRFARALPARGLISLGLVAACGQPASPKPPSPSVTLAQEMTAQLERAAGDWNCGDLDAFVSDYARDTATTFIDGRRARHGFEFIRQNYASRFAPGASRDSLRFEELEARPLGESFALVTARYVLFQNGRTTASGPFTLVLAQRPGGWKIIHDHSSSDPP